MRLSGAPSFHRARDYALDVCRFKGFPRKGAAPGWYCMAAFLRPVLIIRICIVLSIRERIIFLEGEKKPAEAGGLAQTGYSDGGSIGSLSVTWRRIVLP